MTCTKKPTAVAWPGCALLLTCLIAAGAALADDPPVETEWPRVFVDDGHRLVMWQPQVDRWDRFESMSATAAVAITPEGSEEPEFGSVRLTASTQLDADAGTVKLGRRRLTGALFTDTDPSHYGRVRDLLESMLPAAPMEMSLDEIIPYLDAVQYAPRAVEVGMDPPPIFWSEQPAILVIFIGEPGFAPIEGTDLSFAVNTNWDLFRHEPTSQFFLLRAGGWLMTTDVNRGPWQAASRLPVGFEGLRNDPDWTSVSEHVPGTPVPSVPRVIVSTGPAELIVTTGPAQLAAIEGTPLLEVTNTDSDLFVDGDDRQYYVLLAGRWFRSPSLDGPWSAATADLPAAFAKIPEDHPRHHVLASVPGTPEAQAAVLLASVPHTATILRSEARLHVLYEGEPSFAMIEGSDGVRAAQNTEYDVFLVDDTYYCCQQGVWFSSEAPTGTWRICDSIPPEIDSIPTTSPHHYVTYANVYGSSKDTVTVGQTAGYAGAYVTTGLLVFGLGYAITQADSVGVRVRVNAGTHRYRLSYGSGARYDHDRGGFYRSARNYGPGGGTGRGARYDPVSRRHTRGPDRRPGSSAGRPYDAWGRSVVASSDPRSRARRQPGGNTDRRGERGFLSRGESGDVYAASDGRVYRRGESGQWQERSGRAWKSLDGGSNPRSAASSRQRRAELNRNYEARRRGNSMRRSAGGGRGRR